MGVGCNKIEDEGKACSGYDKERVIGKNKDEHIDNGDNGKNESYEEDIGDNDDNESGELYETKTESYEENIANSDGEKTFSDDDKDDLKKVTHSDEGGTDGNGEPSENFETFKCLGTIISGDLKRDENISSIIKKLTKDFCC